MPQDPFARGCADLSSTTTSVGRDVLPTSTFVSISLFFASIGTAIKSIFQR